MRSGLKVHTMRGLPDGCLEIEAEEVLFDVTGPIDTAFHVIAGLPIQPGVSAFASWLSTLGKGFEQYTMEELRLTYQAAGGTQNDGLVQWGVDVDVNDPTPVTLDSFTRLHFRKSASIWGQAAEGNTLVVTAKDLHAFGGKRKFIRTVTNPSTDDAKTFDAGVVFIAVGGYDGTAGALRGQIMGRYRVRLYIPQDPQTVGLFSGGMAPGQAATVVAVTGGNSFSSTSIASGLATGILAPSGGGMTSEANSHPPVITQGASNLKVLRDAAGQVYASGLTAGQRYSATLVVPSNELYDNSSPGVPSPLFLATAVAGATTAAHYSAVSPMAAGTHAPSPPSAPGGGYAVWVSVLTFVAASATVTWKWAMNSGGTGGAYPYNVFADTPLVQPMLTLASMPDPTGRLADIVLGSAERVDPFRDMASAPVVGPGHADWQLLSDALNTGRHVTLADGYGLPSAYFQKPAPTPVLGVETAPACPPAVQLCGGQPEERSTDRAICQCGYPRGSSVTHAAYRAAMGKSATECVAGF